MGRLYTPFKIFRYPEKLKSLPVDQAEIRPPIHLRIKPTNICNHGCSYCAYRSKNQQLGQNMDLRDSIPRSKMVEICDDIIDMGVKAVTFSGGGEPFCYPHLAETAGRLADGGVRIASLTNGSRLVGEAAKVFSARAVWLRVSIDGWDNDSYAAYRNTGPGEFTKVMANLENFKKLGGPCYLGISLIIDHRNWPHLHDFIGRMKDIGVDSVKVSPCIVGNNGQENNAYHADIFDSVRAEVDRAVSDYHRADFEIFDSYHLLDQKFDKDYSWCPYLQILAVIGADQRVYSCQDKAYNLDCGLLGSIKDVSFKEFWMTGKDKFFTINPARDCRHHCVANSKNKMVLDYLDAAPEHLAFV